MKKFTLCCLIAILSLCSARAQEYRTALGLRWGKMNTGISFKYLFDATNAKGIQLEAYRTYIYSRGYTLKGFFIKQGQFRIPLLQIPLDYIYGFGAHAGYFPYTPDPAGRLTYGYLENGKLHPYGKDVVTVGVDATLQVEYQVPERNYPITISVDMNPWYEFINKGPEWIDFGVTARYAFGYK